MKLAKTLPTAFRIGLLLIVAIIGCSSHEKEEDIGEATGALACISPTTAEAASLWEAGKAYAIGNLARYQGQTYRCMLAHTSQPGWEPSIPTTGLWISPPSCITGEWQNQTGYNTGDLVEFEGRIYRAIQGHTSQPNWRPDLAPTLWELVDVTTTKPSCPAYDPTFFHIPEKDRSKAFGVGSARGSFAVSNAGAATYTIPIVVSPGRAGIQPAISLAYNSDAGNGLAGMGFSVAGLSAIQRCGGNNVDDGAPSEVQYSGADHFCLDGSRLELVAGTHGSNNAEYRTTPDSFSRILAFVDLAVAPAGPSSFKVWTKDGRILEYGGRSGPSDEPSARILANNGTVRAWALSRVSDRSGNYMTFRYNRTTTGNPSYTSEWAPDEIRYTGHEPSSAAPTRRVKFFYESRPDEATSRSKGMIFKASQRLQSIRAYGPGDVAIREYTVAYELATGHVTRRSRIESLTECAFPDVASARSCKPSTKFSWRNNSSAGTQFQRHQTDLAMDGPDIYGKYIIADFDGDGRDDIYDPTGKIAFSLGVPDVTSYGTNPIERAFALGYLAWLPAPNVINNDPKDINSIRAEHLIPVDWNGDGRADLIVNNAPTPNANFQVLINSNVASGNLALTFAPIDAGIARDGKAHFADVNGDGTLDLILCSQSTIGGLLFSSYRAHLFDGFTGKFSQTSESVWRNIDRNGHFHCEEDQFASIDVNGDGASDLILGEALMVRRAGPTWEGGPVVGTPLGLRVLDVNGDGLHDIVFLTASGALKISINNGTFPSQSADPFSDIQDTGITIPHATMDSLRDAIVLDYDYDGRQDLVISNNDNPYVLHSTGEGFEQINDPALFEFGYRLRRADITGEGNSAILRFDRSGSPGPLTVLRNSIDTPDLLQSIDDGMQGQSPGQPGYAPSISISYRPLANILFDPNDPQAFQIPTYQATCFGFSYPAKCVRGSKRVVRSYAINSGDDRTGYRLSYQDGAFDVLRGEWLGFHKIQIFDADENGLPLRTPFGSIRKDAGVNVRIFNNYTRDTITKRNPFANHLEYEYRTVGSIYELLGGDQDCESSGASFLSKQSLQTWPDGAKTYSIYTASRRDKLATQGLCMMHASEPAYVFDFGAILHLNVQTTYDPDAYGNIKTITTKVDGAQTTQRSYTYVNDPQNWLISQPLTAKVCDTTLETSPKTDCRFSAQSYVAATNLVRTSTIAPTNPQIGAPDDPDHRVVTTFDRDAFGNVTSVQSVGRDRGNDVGRAACVTYEPEGIYPYALRVGVLPPVFERYNPLLGTLSTVVDLNGNVYDNGYDSFGQQVLQSSPDGSWAMVTRSWKSVTVPPDLRHPFARTETRAHVETLTSDTKVETEFDYWGRPVKSWSRVVGRADLSEESTHYDPVTLQVEAYKAPAFAGGSIVQHSFIHDAFGRPTQHQVSFLRTKHTYNGLISTTTDPMNHTTTVQRDALARVSMVTDARGKNTTYSYGTFGAVTSVTDPGQHITSAIYDAYGRILSATSPDSGTASYTYNAFGQPAVITDGSSQSSEIRYDTMGRRLSLTNADGTVRWKWDTATEGAGKIAAVTGPDPSIGKLYSYGTNGHLSKVTTFVGNEEFSVGIDQDSFGRLQQISYPNKAGQFQVQYNAYDEGSPTEVASSAMGQTFWKWNQADASNRVIDESLANGAMKTTRTYEDLQAGVLTSIRTTTASSAIVQDLSYLHDGALNVFSRKDNGGWLTAQQTPAAPRTEHFCYDELDRLVGSSLTSTTCPASGSPQFTYDDDGNITNKFDVGAYTYVSNRPHAVVRAGEQWYGYDKNGNQVTRPRDAGDTKLGVPTISYNRMNKPVLHMRGNVWRGANALSQCNAAAPSGSCRCDTVADPITGTPGQVCSDDTVQFKYDGDGTRVRKVTKTTDTIYVGGIYERTKDLATGAVDHKYYVNAPTRAVAVVTKRVNQNGQMQPAQTRYLHTDNLGSVDVITDETGAEKERYSFDAFGQRRNPDWSAGTPNGPAIEKLGFTGHEQEDELKLVNMKGRQYDPKIGRFLAADPIVHNPLAGQHWNRYSYVFNNPLTLRDPSGYDPEGGGPGGPSSDFPPFTPGPPGASRGGDGGTASSVPCPGTSNLSPSGGTPCFGGGGSGAGGGGVSSPAPQPQQVSSAAPVVDAAPEMAGGAVGGVPGAAVAGGGRAGSAAASPMVGGPGGHLVDRAGRGPFGQAVGQIMESIRTRDNAVNTFAGLIAAAALMGPMYIEDIVLGAERSGEAFVHVYTEDPIYQTGNLMEGLKEAGVTGFLVFGGLEERAVAEGLPTAARTFSSADSLVGDLANAIEAAHPGHVVGVNVPIRNAAGQLVTDADIFLKNAIIQVKSGSGVGLTRQLLRTEAATGLPVIGYGPNLGGSVVKGIQAAGGLVTRDQALLIQVIAP